jgi:cytochrome c biogenesis protein CcmG/thiol:disulfide interchange protein DsbE
MKKLLILLQIVLVFSYVSAQTSGGRTMPSVQIKTLDGKNVLASEISNEGKPMIVSFWATWCKPCIRELTTIADVYEDWQEETGVKLVAISIDDTRSLSKVRPFVNGKGWEYEFYTDANSDLKRAMNVNEIPCVFILDGNGNIVWQHTSFAEGGELKLINIVKKIIAGEDVSKE